MVRSQAVAAVERRLGKRGNLSSDIIEEMKLAQSRLEMGPILPWFLEKVSPPLSTSGKSLDTPTDFLREAEDIGPLWRVSGEGLLLMERSDFYALEKAWLGVKGAPVAYAMVGKTIILFPEPDANYQFKMAYYGADTVLDSDIENLWLKYTPDLLIAETGMEMARILRDPVAFELFKDRRQAAWDLFVADHTVRRTSRGVMGG